MLIYYFWPCFLQFFIDGLWEVGTGNGSEDWQIILKDTFYIFFFFIFSPIGCRETISGISWDIIGRIRSGPHFPYETGCTKIDRRIFVNDQIKFQINKISECNHWRKLAYGRPSDYYIKLKIWGLKMPFHKQIRVKI